MELTREQRLEIYKLAKEMYVSGINNNNMSGICIELRRAVYSIHGVNIVAEHIDNIFPELKSVQLDRTTDGLFWWPLEDIDSRLKAFDLMIELASNDK